MTLIIYILTNLTDNELGIHSELILEVANRLHVVVDEEFDIFRIAPYQVVSIPNTTIVELMAPDILVHFSERRRLAIEIESDIGFDFDQSMRQLQKYKQVYEVKVVIPKMYEKFAPLYENDGIEVFLWSGDRCWRCMRCGKDFCIEGNYKPKCPDCNKGDVMLFKLQNFALRIYR